MDRLREVAGWVVLTVWVGSMLLNAVDRSYNPPPFVNIAAGVVLTFLFAAPRILRRRDDDE